MIAPAASRHSVAVSRMLYSRGCLGAARAAPGRRRPRGISGLDSTSAHELLEAPPAFFEVGELVEARAGGREQDDVAGHRRRPGGGHRVLEVAPAPSPYHRGDLLGRL